MTVCSPRPSAARPTTACLWPPNHKLVSVGITGASDPDSNATITVDGGELYDSAH
ncbi:MAG: hypothetical protein HY824_12635 [Acidobacteria bacterium]|nr:hypothetical protein [Acidobacteriota bacterium]